VAKLIKILAASVGGGLVLGAGIRLGEAIASRNPATGADADHKLGERLSELEGRLRSLEGEQAEPEQNSKGSPPVPHSEIRDWLEEAVMARMDTVADQIQTRLITRISKLEEEVAGQSAAMSELRECSLRTERSIQRLLGSIDKLIVRQPSPAKEAADPPTESEPTPQTAEASAA
jgi:uncharacterized coiled-coil protein SlyX